jgi:hypothetical protein
LLVDNLQPVHCHCFGALQSQGYAFTMEKQFVALTLFLFFNLGVTDAFLIPQPSFSLPVVQVTLQAAPVPQASEDKNSDDKASYNVTPRQSTMDADTTIPLWTKQWDGKLLKEVRLELVQKYLDQGVPQDVAEQEVDIFLQDKERSEKYLEMRTYAALQVDDLGLGLGLQLLGGFLIGFIGIVGPKYYQAYKAVNPVDDGPLPML